MPERESIAITGIGCRFPGGGNGPEAFWNLLCEGVDAITEIPPDRWNIRRFYSPEPGLPGKTDSRWGGFIGGLDQFDAAFFGISPREAAFMDPQQRLLLETAWEAMEDAGHVVDFENGADAGVFVGISTFDYWRIQASFADKTTIGPHSTTGTVLSIAANRLSYVFNFRGPSFVVDTACSSSLFAVHLACRSIWNGECPMALAAGVNAIIHPDTFIGFSKMAMLSPDGRCKAFDARGNGFVRGEGAGVIVLKPLSAALAGGDRIYAVVRGTAVNQDGRTSSLTVPGADAQERLIRDACADAGVAPDEVDYVEAHGTGTAVGDPIETSAIGAALGDGRTKKCVIGSVKTNIGHLEAGSGIAGIIKTALVLDRGAIPPNLHFQTPNPDIKFDEWKLRVPVALEKLPRADAVAGINSFGFGGTNAHVVLQRPDPRPAAVEETERPQLFTLSARDAESLRAAADNHRRWLAGTPELFGDICHTLATRRRHHGHRLAIAAASKREAVEKLGAFLDGESRPGLSAAIAAPGQKIAFVFTGQGPQWWAMGRELLATDEIFRAKIGECDALFSQLGDWSLIEELTRNETASRMQETAVAQPAIFALQVALAAWWRAHGVESAAVAGHSVGEAAAAHICGALSLADAAKVIFHRGRCMQAVPPTGKMLAVALTPEAAQPFLAEYEGRAEIGAVNSPRSVTISGEAAALEKIARRLEAENIWCRFLRVNYAFHSAQMDPVEPELKNALRGIESGGMTLPMISTVTGRFLPEEKLNADYWWRNVRKPVLFATAIDALATGGFTTFLEIGPHPALSGSVTECLKARGVNGLVTGSLRRGEPERLSLLSSLGALHVNGVSWRRNGGGRCVSLPPCAWHHERCWHEAEESVATRLGPPAHPLLGRALDTADPAWELKPDHQLLPWLGDHRVQGRVVFPAAAYVEMALAAGQEIHPGSPLVLEEIEFRRALFLPDDEDGTRMQLSVSAGEGLFRIDAKAESSGHAWTPHCAGKLRAASGAATPPPVDVPQILLRNTTGKTSAESYDLFRAAGLEFGPAFQGVRRVWRRDGEAFGEIEAPDGVQMEDYQIHPVVLDSCFQILLWALPAREGPTLYLPVQIGRVRFFAKPGRKIRSHVRLVDHGEKSITAAIRLLDEAGRVLADIEGFRCNAIEQARPDARQAGDCFYEIQWREENLERREAAAAQGAWLVVSGDEPLAREMASLLKSSGDECEVVADADGLGAQLRGGLHIGRVIFLANAGAQTATSANELCCAMLRAVQTLAAHEAAPPLALVTRGAQPADDAPPAAAQGALLGLARVVMNEHPELQCRAVDLSAAPSSSEIRALLDELRGGDEEEVALREDRRFAPRLAHMELQPECASGTETPFRLGIVKPGVIDDIEFRDAERRAPQAGEVEVEVLAAGLNFRDVMKVLGIYPVEQAADNLLGDECAGRVTAVGEGVAHLRPGDEVVGISPGCFTKYTTLRAAFAVRKPARLSFEEAATIPVAFLTAHYALHHLARLAPGERVLIHAAAGGVGMAALQLARLAGAEIFATAGSDEKRALARSLGAAHVMDSRSLDFADEVRAITDGRGVDIVLNSLAGEAIPKSISILAPYGRFLEIGKRDIYQNSRIGLRPFSRNLSFFAIDLAQLLRDRPALIGTMLAGLMRQFESGDLKPLPRSTFPIAKAADAFRHMAQGKHSGKIVFSLDNAAVPVRRAAFGPARFRADATYLVTGGVRGFGLAAAEWMIGHGARNLVLLGAGETSARTARKHLAGHARNGVSILAGAVDVSDEAALAALFSKIRDTLPPLRGVVHAAMKMDDGVLRQLDAARFAGVMAPKAGGAWNLHRLTRDLPLDFFVMFSSVSSLVGNPGQANYAAANAFLDALAHHRRAFGLPAVAVNWGHIGGTGYAARHAHVSDHLARCGVAAIPLDEALEMLGKIIQSGAAQVAAMRIDWERWAEANPRVRKSRRYADVIPSAVTEQPVRAVEDPATAILRATGDTRRRLLESFLREQAARVLGTSPSKLDPARPLNELGLDSLLAIELQNRIEAGLGLPVPSDKLMGGPSVEKLAAILSAALPQQA